MQSDFSETNLFEIEMIKLFKYSDRPGDSYLRSCYVADSFITVKKKTLYKRDPKLWPRREGVSDQLRLKPVGSATWISKNIKILHETSLTSKLSRQRITMAHAVFVRI